jgi:hypothetical protein
MANSDMRVSQTDRAAHLRMGLGGCSLFVLFVGKTPVPRQKGARQAVAGRMMRAE